MSNPTQYSQPPMPPYMPQAPAPKPKRNWLVPVIVLFTLLIGFSVGSAANPAPPPVETIKEVEKRVEVPVVPSECKVAFGHAEELFASAGRTGDIFKDAIDAVAKMNVPGINAQTEKIKAETAVVDATGPKYIAAKAKCLAG